MTYVKPDRAVMGTKFRNNPRSMARTKKRLKIIIMGLRDSALLPHSLLFPIKNFPKGPKYGSLYSLTPALLTAWSRVMYTLGTKGAYHPPGVLLSSNRLIGMCRWMGSHFVDWIEYNGVEFSIELLEWGGAFSGFWG